MNVFTNVKVQKEFLVLLPVTVDEMSILSTV